MKKLSFLLALSALLIFISRCGNNSTEANTGKDTEHAVQQMDSAIFKKYLEEGGKYAAETGKVLIKNLTGAIQSKGTAYAVEFCNIKAMLLTDSMSAVQMASIKRVSDKARNKKNEANQQELGFIHDFNNLLQKGDAIKPKLVENENSVTGYFPIITNSLCMNCHGDKEKIDTETLTKINKLYPADAATGYKENQLRGLWVVEMKKK